MSPELPAHGARFSYRLGKLDTPPAEMISGLEAAGLPPETGKQIKQVIGSIQEELSPSGVTADVSITNTGEIVVQATHPGNPPFKFREVVPINLK